MTHNTKPAWGTILRWTGVLALIALFAAAILNEKSGVAKGVHAPPILGADLQGKKVALYDFKGRPAVVNFWGTWCPPCRAELPEFVRAHRDLGDKVDFYGIACESPAPQVQAMAQKLNIGYKLILPYDEVLQAYKIRSFPTTFIIDPHGTIVRTHNGMVDYATLKKDLQPYL